jgi:hypothetical protein
MNGRLENVPLSRDATAIESAVLVVVSLTGRPENTFKGDNSLVCCPLVGSPGFSVPMKDEGILSSGTVGASQGWD